MIPKRIFLANTEITHPPFIRLRRSNCDYSQLLQSFIAFLLFLFYFFPYHLFFPGAIMSIAASRAVLRQQRLLVGRPAIRSASNASNAAGKTKEAASKTQENLTKVANSAGPVLQNFVKSLRSFGGPAAKIVSFFDCKQNTQFAS